MLKNYIKIAWKVMLRRKAFTVITLLVIALYLMLMTIGGTFIDLVLNSYPPQVNRMRTLSVDQVKLVEVKDNAPTKNARGNRLSLDYIQRYVAPLEKPEKIAWYRGQVVERQEEGRTFFANYCNKDFWEILEFSFIAGRSFSQQEIDNRAEVCVISEKWRKHYLEDEKPIGQMAKVGNKSYKIIGIIETLHSFTEIQGDIFIPYTLSPPNPSFIDQPPEFGDYSAMLLASSISDITPIQDEYNLTVSKIASSDPENFPLVKSEANDWFEIFKNLLSVPADVIIILATLFIALPASSLLNINTSRIMERYSEIGIRKAFGASSRVLVGQFVVENIIFSLLGGLLGFILSTVFFLIFMHIAKNTLYIVFPSAVFLLNWRILLLCILGSILYGLATGVYPAWRMSKVHPVEALKHG